MRPEDSVAGKGADGIRRGRCTRIGIFVLALLSHLPVAAGVFYENFSSANVTKWTHGGQPKAEIVLVAGKPVLRVNGREQLTLKVPCEGRRDFVLQVKVRGPGGVHFREVYKVFFKPDGDVWVRRPGAMLLDWIRTPRDVGEYHTIRVACVGRIVRVYVDDLLEFEGIDHAPAAGAFYLCGSGDFAWVRIDDEVPPREALMVLPKDAGANFVEEDSYARMKLTGPRVQDVALAFRTDEQVRVPIQVLQEKNDARSGVRVRAVLDDFGEGALASAPEQAITLAGIATVDSVVDLGRVRAGFYRLQLTLMEDGAPIRTTSYPVFVGVPREPAVFARPVFPLGVSLQSIVWKPIHTKTYWHAVAALLRANHLNTVTITNPHREFPETFEQYGIAAFGRTESRSEHPAMLGIFTSLTDPEAIRSLEQATGKPVLNYLPLEALGTGDKHDPLVIWAATRPRIRVVQIQPFRRGSGDWLARDGPHSLLAALRSINRDVETPWWAAIQAFGSKEGNGDFRPPLPAELCALVHLVIAHGAKGIIFNSLQGKGEVAGLVDRISLRPLDQRLAAISGLAGQVEGAAEILATLTAGGHQVACDARDVVATPVTVGGRPGVYIVNPDARRAIKATLSWSALAPGQQVREGYSGNRLVVAAAGRLLLNLAPGAGQLLIRD